MEQYSKILPEQEPKIFKSVKRIAEYYLRASRYISRYKKDFCDEIIYTKSVAKLPHSYDKGENAFVILNIGKYDLQNSEHWTHPVSGEVNKELKKLYSNLSLECHIDLCGNILAIYIA